MTAIYVLSRAGNLLNIINRKRFEKDMKVPYKGKWYKVHDRRKTKLGEYAIYPYGGVGKWKPSGIARVEGKRGRAQSELKR